MESELSIDLGRVAQDLQLKKTQVASVVELLDSGNTVPFITRYRKEQTGGLDEEQIRAIQHRVGHLRQMAERRQTILRTIESQGKLTEELKSAIERADTLKRLEDLYLPYKPKKQTLATIAREKGLGPLADAIWNRDEAVGNLHELLPGMINPDKQLASVEDVLTGVQHIIAEKIAEDAEVRQSAREVLWQGNLQTSRAPTTDEGPTLLAPEGGPQPGLDEFRNYFSYEEPIRHVPPHRVLAINRGERRGVLRVRLDFPRDLLIDRVKACLSLEGHPHRELIEKCVTDAVDRLLVRSLEREVRGEVTEFAEVHAVEVFARNLRNLLLQPPVHGKRVLAIDPGYRTGCKWAVLDEIGNLLEHGNVFPHLKRKKKKRKKGAADGSEATATAVQEPSSSRGEAVEVSEAESEDPPTLPADEVHRSTEPGDPTDHGLEKELENSGETESSATEPSAAETFTTEPSAAETPAPAPTRLEDEVDREWKEITSRPFEGSSASPARPKPRKPRRPKPAWLGIVIPPPGLFSDERKTESAPPKGGEEEGTITRRERVKRLLADVCGNHRVDVVVIGNGTACRETEELIAELIADGLISIPYVIANEAGASVYSTSTVGREEFPEFDATLRSTISIGRRLQDPLSELVKIDPQNIGVGLYQHDINPRLLRESLSEVVESCVNYVGVDLNTASVPLLRYVSGLNQLRAKNLVEYRKQHGPFRVREDLQKVSGIGPETFTQAAGFLKITGGDQPLDSTWIHPESYPTAKRVLESLGYDPGTLGSRIPADELRQKAEEMNPAEITEGVQASEPTIWDILDNLIRPGRDPREDLPKPIFRTGILRIEDLQPGMELQGTVLNVVDFGVFVDIGLKDSGLVHISQVADRFIRSPHDVVSVGDIVTTWVLNVDMQRRRVSLTMIDPSRPRPQRGQRPRRERRPSRPPEEARREQGEGQPQQPDQGEGRHQHRGGQRQPQQRQDGPRLAGERRPPEQQQRGQRRDQQGRGRRGGPPPRRSDQPRIISSRPKEKKPPVKLTDEKLTGQQDLHSFGELKALFEHRKDEPAAKKPKSPPEKEPPAGGSAEPPATS